MKDPAFISHIVERIRDAKEKARRLTELTTEQLNFKPGPESWSAGQCLDHLLVSDLQYFPVLKKIAEGKYKMNRWERISPFSGFFGRMIADQVRENVKRKLKAPGIFTPSSSDIDNGIHERFQKHLDSLIAYVAACSLEDLDQVKITSPVSKLITYNLRHTFLLLSEHLHRHLNQAERAVKVCTVDKV